MRKEQRIFIQPAGHLYLVRPSVLLRRKGTRVKVIIRPTVLCKKKWIVVGKKGILSEDLRMLRQNEPVLKR